MVSSPGRELRPLVERRMLPFRVRAASRTAIEMRLVRVRAAGVRGWSEQSKEGGGVGTSSWRPKKWWKEGGSLGRGDSREGRGAGKEKKKIDKLKASPNTIFPCK